MISTNHHEAHADSIFVPEDAPLRAWHFLTGEPDAPTLRDGRPAPRVGEPLVYTGPLKACRSGLHASVQLLQALRYAPGPVLAEVDCSGWIYPQEDKLVCSRRVIRRLLDSTPALRAFGRRVALAVFNQVETRLAVSDARDWLLTGDEHYRAAAYSAARLAAWSAARSAANAAANATVYSAAYLAAYSAADSAARSAAYSAADSVAYSAASWAANTLLTGYVEEAFAGRTDWTIEETAIGSWKGLHLA